MSEEVYNIESARYIFVIEDDAIQTEMLKDYLTERYLLEVKTYTNGEDALNDVAKFKPEIVVLDYHLNSSNRAAKNGIEILKEIKAKSPESKVVMFSGEDNLNIALESMKSGSYDYIIKGETAFNKLENVINKLGDLHKMESINKAQKRTITMLGIVIAIIVIVAFIVVAKLQK
ncbi:MAG: response regulator [Chitinophagaceae bacterium]|nr:response regulator [Chitinophagaceae bacterium]